MPSVVITPNPSSYNPGRKDIVVDGAVWGRIYRDQHGVHGHSYWFEQVEGNRISETVPRANKPGETWEKPISVRSNAKAIRYQKIFGVRDGQEVERPLADRLHETAVRLIDKGLLRNPEIIRAEYRAKKQKEDQASLKFELKENIEWRAKAAQALKANSIYAIIDAMKWAQTR